MEGKYRVKHIEAKNIELQNNFIDLKKNLNEQIENEKAKIKIYDEAPAVEFDIAPNIEKTLESSIVLEGSRYIFECKAVGTRPFNIKWFKNGVELNDNENYSFNYDDKTGCIVLIINRVTKSENALFSCRVTNELGMAETSAYLKVKGK
jgi:hypothetical protein